MEEGPDILARFIYFCGKCIHTCRPYISRFTVIYIYIYLVGTDVIPMLSCRVFIVWCDTTHCNYYLFVFGLTIIFVIYVRCNRYKRVILFILFRCQSPVVCCSIPLFQN